MAEILKYPEEIDCTLRENLFAFLGDRVQALVSDDKLNAKADVTLAMLKSFSNMLSSLTRDIGTLSASSGANATDTASSLYKGNTSAVSANDTSSSSDDASSLEDAIEDTTESITLNCSTSIVEEAKSFAEVVNRAISDLTQKQLEKTVPGQKAAVMSAGGMCIISQRNDPAKFQGSSAAG